jgi:hypothetical protein
MALSAPTTMNAPASAGTAALSETSASSTRTTSAASTFSTVGAMARPQRGGLLVEVVPVRLPWASPAEHAPNERHGRIRHVAEGQDGRIGPVSLDGETDEEPPDHVPKRDRSDVAPGTPGFGTSSTEGTRAMLPPLWPPGTRSWENLGFFGEREALSHALFDLGTLDPAVQAGLGDPEVFIADELAAEHGIGASENRVHRLCSQHGIFSVLARRRGRGIRPGPAVHDDLVRRDFTADAPNRLWLTDITEHRTAEGKLYLCAVKDAF